MTSARNVKALKFFMHSFHLDKLFETTYSKCHKSVAKLKLKDKYAVLQVFEFFEK